MSNDTKPLQDLFAEIGTIDDQVNELAATKSNHLASIAEAYGRGPFGFRGEKVVISKAKKADFYTLKPMKEREVIDVD